MVNIGSENGLSPVRRQAITWTNPDSLSVGHVGTIICEILIKIQTSSSKKTYLKMAAKRQPFYYKFFKLNLHIVILSTCCWSLMSATEPLMTCQDWSRKWLDAVRQQAITWVSVDPDLWRHMAPPGPQWVNHHNELIMWPLSTAVAPFTNMV